MAAVVDGGARRVFEVLGRSFDQVGIVVPAIEAVLPAYEGMGPWSVYTYDRAFVPDLRAGDGASDFAMRLALNPDHPQLELIEPLDERSPYAIWMAAAGPGIHHLGYLVDDIEATTAAMNAAGFATLLSGSGYGIDGDGGFCYYDTVDAVGHVTEAIERPAQRREPDAILP